MDVSSKLVVAIMAGGSGTRFWPLSREDRPKQFVALTGQRTMLQITFDRLAGLVPPERILVLTNARFAELARTQLPELPFDNVIGEPMPRDTSGAVALASALIAHRWPGAVQAILSADHTIEPAARFREVLLGAAESADADGGLHTLGIRPREAATGYGYLEVAQQLSQRRGAPVHRLSAFREKPDLATAQGFLASGRHLWNSGMFVWRTDDIQVEIRRHLPAHATVMEAVGPAWGTHRFGEVLAAAFEPLPKVSIDFGVMEKASDVRCAIADFEWNDVGGWAALRDVVVQDAAGNWAVGDVRALDASGNVVLSERAGHPVLLVGVEGLVVVAGEGGTLVCPIDQAERIKSLVQGLSGR